MITESMTRSHQPSGHGASPEVAQLLAAFTTQKFLNPCSPLRLHTGKGRDFFFQLVRFSSLLFPARASGVGSAATSFDMSDLFCKHLGVANCLQLQ